MNDKNTLLELVASTPEWTPATTKSSDTTTINSTDADLPEKRKAGRPRKDSDDFGKAEVVGGGRGAKKLLHILAGMQDDYRLYYDNTKISYIKFTGKGLEPLGKNGALEDRLALLYYKTTGETLGSDGFVAATKVLAGLAKEIGTEIELHTRS